MDAGEAMDRIEAAVRLLSGNTWAALRVTRAAQRGPEQRRRVTVHTIAVSLVDNGAVVARSEFVASITTYRDETGETPPTFAELVAELHRKVMAAVEEQRRGADALLGPVTP